MTTYSEYLLNFFAIFGVLAGAVRMLHSESAEQSFGEVLLMLTSYLLVGFGINWVIAHIPFGAIDIVITGSVQMAVSHWRGMAVHFLRERAARCRTLAKERAVVDGNQFARMMYYLLGGLVNALIGVVNGVAVAFRP